MRLYQHQVPWSHIDWFKFCIHFTSLNAHHFGMVETTELNIWH
jgi:hypothetical protein